VEFSLAAAEESLQAAFDARAGQQI
jgi:hypothetical protein